MEKFDHAHIIRFLGICYDGPLLIIMELAKFGQLKNYLQNNKDKIEVVTLILYSYQLSSAMAYLESKKFVHRDIAARNGKHYFFSTWMTFSVLKIYYLLF